MYGLQEPSKTLKSEHLWKGLKVTVTTLSLKTCKLPPGHIYFALRMQLCSV